MLWTPQLGKIKTANFIWSERSAREPERESASVIFGPTAAGRLPGARSGKLPQKRAPQRPGSAHPRFIRTIKGIRETTIEKSGCNMCSMCYCCCMITITLHTASAPKLMSIESIQYAKQNDFLEFDGRLFYMFNTHEGQEIGWIMTSASDRQYVKLCNGIIRRRKNHEWKITTINNKL